MSPDGDRRNILVSHAVPIAMNWMLIGTLLALGTAHGGATLFGWTWRYEYVAWALTLLAVGIAVGLKAMRRPVLHAWLGGIAATLGVGGLQLLFFGTYLAHNPRAGEVVDQVAGGPVLFTLAMTPVFGSALGFGAALIAWLFREATKVPVG